MLKRTDKKRNADSKWIWTARTDILSLMSENPCRLSILVLGLLIFPATEPAAQEIHGAAPSTATKSVPESRHIDPDMWEAVQKLGNGDGGEGIQASNKLLRSPRRAIPALLNGLDDPNKKVRRGALFILEEIGNPKVVPDIERKILQDEDFLVRAQAMSIIESFMTYDWFPILVRVIETDKATFCRRTAIGKLSYLYADKAVPILRKSLQDSDLGVRLTAARELGRHQDDAGYELAVQSLSHEDRRIREAATEALGYIGRKESLEMLRNIIAVADTRRDRGLVWEVIRSIQRIEFRYVPEAQKLAHLETAMRDPRPAVRDWASRELYAMDNGDAEALLKKIIAEPKHIGEREARRALQGISNRKKRSRNPFVRIPAELAELWRFRLILLAPLLGLFD